GISLAVISFLLADWFGNEIKGLAQRVRPCNALEGVRTLAGCSKSYSMPSNHAANSFAYATALFFFFRASVPLGWRIYPLVLAAFVGLSRVYVGVHYPTDVLAGALLGTVISPAVIGSFRFFRKRYQRNPYTTSLFVGIAVLSLFRIYYILQGPLDLSFDEAHYWEWSRRPDLSYYSKGPMIAWLILAGTTLFGDTVFGIRILAVLLSVLSSLLIFDLCRMIYPGREGERTGVTSALLLQLIPLFAPFGSIFTIDSPFIFFWALSLWLFWRAVSAGKGRDWILLGISMGLGLLTKYTMAFFVVSAIGFLAIWRREVLKGWMPWGSGLISLVVFSPVVIWNIRNGWVTMKHTAGQAHLADGLVLSPMSFIEFLGSQVGVITPIVFVMMVVAFVRLMREEGDLRSRFLLSFSVPVVGFFLFKSIQGKVQVNWALTGYITAIVAFSHVYLSRLGNLKPMVKRVTIAGVLLAVLVTALAHYPFLVLPRKMDPTARLRGWKALGAEVTEVCRTVSAGGPVLIFSDRYQIASELAFYVEGQPRTYCINLDRRMNQYDLWPDLNSAAAGLKGAVRGVLVMDGADNTIPPEVLDAFERCEKKVVEISDRGQRLREYSIFICYNFKGLKVRRPETF
ncbi:MAG: phosphatase PAP2 family protein, partial [Nitrospirales bacterium]|nr:phosphatase PAP2 family protein [Nitrospirales bacterium]